jgi:ABC-type phosphate/phosphonate transport system ATPase subunit
VANATRFAKRAKPSRHFRRGVLALFLFFDLRDIFRREGVAILCSLHQIHLARAYADRIVGLVDGRLVTDVETAAFDATIFTRVYGPSAVSAISAKDQ